MIFHYLYHKYRRFHLTVCLLSPAAPKGREILQRPPSVCPSVRLFCFKIFHVFFAFHAISNIKKRKNWWKKKKSGGGGGVLNFFFQFFLISRFMLFSTLQKIETPPSVRPSCLVYWLNGRWFLQIPVVDGDSWNLCPLYPLCPCSDFVSQMWGWFGGGVMFFSHFMLFPTFLEKKSGNTKQLFLI